MITLSWSWVLKILTKVGVDRWEEQWYLTNLDVLDILWGTNPCLIVLSMCNLIKWILEAWEYRGISFRKACIGYHLKSTVKGGEKGGSHICWKELLTTWSLKSANCSPELRRDILMAHLGITMSIDRLTR
jgi:hypothetical protein